jgi:hypothetical protein
MTEDERQHLITRQAALKAAAEFAPGGSTTAIVLQVAQEFDDWVWSKQPSPEKAIRVLSGIVQPEPEDESIAFEPEKLEPKADGIVKVVDSLDSLQTKEAKDGKTFYLITTGRGLEITAFGERREEAFRIQQLKSFQQYDNAQIEFSYRTSSNGRYKNLTGVKLIRQ